MPEFDEQGGLTLEDYVRILRRNWILVLIMTALGAVVAGVFTLLATPQYKASTQLYVSVQSAADTGALTDLTQGGSYARQAVLSYVDVVRSASVLGEVVKDLKLNMTVEELREMVTASNPRDTVLIDIDVVSADPAQAAAVANSVGTNFAQVVVDVLEKPRGGGISPVQVSSIEQATTPRVPVSPNLPLNLAIGLVIGLMTGVASAAARTVLDKRVRSPKDLTHLTDLPMLGTIIDDARANSHRLIVHTNPRSPRAESIRGLRTNLQFVNVDGSPRSFVITSSAPGEGKTTVSTNLAVALAQAGASVALVDGDLRKPTVATVMGVDGDIGLSSVLAGMVRIEDVVQKWGKSELFVIPAGRIPPNPSELLGSAEMTELMARLVSEFDYVIVDAPPVLAVTDAAILSRLAGGTIMVAAVGLARKDEVAAALEALEGRARRIIGLVATRAPVRGPESSHFARYEYEPDNSVVPTKPREQNPLSWLDDAEVSARPLRRRIT